jgi:hypothetical protein
MKTCKSCGKVFFYRSLDLCQKCFVYGNTKTTKKIYEPKRITGRQTDADKAIHGKKLVFHSYEEEERISSKFTTTIIQGKPVTVSLRDKKNWEKHTTEDQRNNLDFETSFSNGLIKTSDTLDQ